MSAQVLTTTPVDLGSGTTLELLTIHNTGSAGAYVKVYDSATSPTVSSAIPTDTFYAPPGESKQYVVLRTGSLWIACAAEALAGDTASDGDVIVTEVSR